MSETIKFTIDGKACTAEAGQTILQAATANGVYIPALCYFEGIGATGTCRICTVMVNGRPMAACTTPVAEGLKVENDTAEIQEMRKTIIEMLFVEGNHFCPACEKSGNCELQALAYRYQMMAPRFEYEFSQREIDASSPKLLIERNRCILCKRCVKSLFTKDGKALFAIANRGCKSTINLEHGVAAEIDDEMAQRAMDLCPVGAIIRKEKGFDTPIGQRKYDKQPIGSGIKA